MSEWKEAVNTYFGQRRQSITHNKAVVLPLMPGILHEAVETHSGAYGNIASLHASSQFAERCHLDRACPIDRRWE